VTKVIILMLIGTVFC